MEARAAHTHPKNTQVPPRGGKVRESESTLIVYRLSKGPNRKWCCNAVYRFELFWLKVFRLQEIHQIKSALKMPLSRSNDIKLYFKWASSCLPNQRWNYEVADALRYFTIKLILNLLQQKVNATDQKKFTSDLQRFGHSHQTSTPQEELDIRSAITMILKTRKDASYFKFTSEFSCSVEL